VSVTVTPDPASVRPGQVVGKPMRIPAILLCTQGERFCGRTWVANTARELPEKLADRRVHEASCQGGLIVAGAQPFPRPG
jgi:hypothetical protein